MSGRVHAYFHISSFPTYTSANLNKLRIDSQKIGKLHKSLELDQRAFIVVVLCLSI